MAGRNIGTDILGIVERDPTINSKQKGNANERGLCKLLRKWTGADFNRTPASGGLRWLDASMIAGDVVAPANFYFPMCVETKHLAALHVPRLLPRKCTVYGIWAQAAADAERVKKIPICFIRTNRMVKDRYYVFMAVDTLCPDFFRYAIEICRGYTEGREIVGFMSEDVLGTLYERFLTFLNLPPKI